MQSRRSLSVILAHLRLLLRRRLRSNTRWQRRIDCGRFALHPSTNVQEQDTQTTPGQTRHDSRIHNVSPRIRKAFDQSNDGRYTHSNTPTDNGAFACRVDHPHTVQWSEKEVIPLGAIFARNQGKGSCHNQGTEFLLKTFVTFDISEPQTRDNISSGETKIV